MKRFVVVFCFDNSLGYCLSAFQISITVLGIGSRIGAVTRLCFMVLRFILNFFLILQGLFLILCLKPECRIPRKTSRTSRALCREALDAPTAESCFLPMEVADSRSTMVQSHRCGRGEPTCQEAVDSALQVERCGYLLRCRKQGLGSVGQRFFFRFRR